EAALGTAERARWAGRPDDALQEVQRALALYQSPDLAFACGRLLAAGMRACADLAERARARRGDHAADAAQAAAGNLTAWLDRMGGIPFAGHPLMATIPADRATWDAERTRLAGAGDPTACDAAPTTWEDPGCPHPPDHDLGRAARAPPPAG